jgi:SAM-dependent methyltransferase
VTDEYLATGFRDVDGRGDPAAYRDCLRFIGSLPYYREVKGRSYDLLRLAPGLAVLDVGSGVGDDAFRMARRVMPGGLVVGIDASERMVEEARSRAPEGFNVRFEKADARTLPFDNATFDRVRIDRTLQHIPRPEAVLGEMVRVLKPGGLLLAYDNDWETFSIMGADGDATKIIENLWRNSFANPRMGRDLEGCVAVQGLADIECYQSVSVITDFATTDKIYNLTESARRAVDTMLLTPERADRWLQGLRSSSLSGEFRCTLTACTVVAKRTGNP